MNFKLQRNKSAVNRITLGLASLTLLYFVFYVGVPMVDARVEAASPRSGMSFDLMLNNQVNYMVKEKSLISSVVQKQSGVATQIIQQAHNATIRQAKINIASHYLSRKGSPMAPYAALIVDTASRCGGDYKTIIAIAEVESGLGKNPVNKYNPFGYLNGVKYGSWSAALSDLVCKISAQYSAKYGTDFVSMGKRYASNPYWGQKVSGVYYGIK